MQFGKNIRSTSITKLLITVIFLTLFSLGAMAQQKVATGKPGKTYSTMYKELSAQCNDAAPTIEFNTNGSGENLDLLVKNKVNMALVQTDALFYKARTQDLSNIKTLAALHAEEIHVVVLTQPKVKTGGYGIGGLKVGQDAVVFRDISSLAGYRVAVSGGSFFTADLVKLQANIAYVIQTYADDDKAKAALDAGEAEAWLTVGGQPLGTIEKLTSAYRLLPISGAASDALKGVYVPAKLNYDNLGAGGQGISTVATEALLVTRTYESDKTLAQLAALRSCLYASLAEIKDTTGTHPKWQGVRKENRGKWSQWYDLSAFDAKKSSKK